MIFALTVLEVVGIIYVYGFKRVLEDIKFMLGIELGIYWKFCWGFLVPVALSFFFFYYTFTFEQITYAGNSYPDVVICKYCTNGSKIKESLFFHGAFRKNRANHMCHFFMNIE